MKFFSWRKNWLQLILVMVLLAGLLLAVTGCEEFGQFPVPTSPEEEQEPEKVTLPTVVSTKDSAILAVHEHLLGLAESHEAKKYLAEFYAACDNWSAESEYFKDGSGTWYILVDMTESETWELKPYWQQASWFVFRDGRVIPSSHLQANAIRIEADLQELSLQEKPLGEKS